MLCTFVVLMQPLESLAKYMLTCITLFLTTCVKQLSQVHMLVKGQLPFGTQGLDVLAPTMKAGNLARPRHFEIGAALNRLRTVKMRRQQ